MTDPFLSDQSGAVPDKSSGMKILVADDDRTLREGCASVLQADGHTVTATGRGEEAIELVRRRRFDLVLVDLYLTPVTGLEILRAAVEAHKDTVVVVMTGNPTVASSIEALRAGAWDYLPKPFSASHLQVLVGRAAHVTSLNVGEKTTTRAVVSTPSAVAGDAKTTLLGISPAFRKAV